MEVEGCLFSGFYVPKFFQKENFWGGPGRFCQKFCFVLLPVFFYWVLLFCVDHFKRLVACLIALSLVRISWYLYHFGGQFWTCCGLLSPFAAEIS